jgi:peptidoglycan/LPS O-acetylase OafA/YrhL
MFQYYLRLPDLEGPYWTMIVEMIFYVFMGGLFFFRQLGRIHTIGITICMLLAAAAFSVDTTHWVKAIFMQVPLLYHFPLFFAGILFYGKYTGSLHNRIFFVGIAIAFLAQMALFPHTWRACKHMSQTEYLVVLTLFFSVFFLFVSGKLERIANPVTLFFGKISYPLYLTHQYLSINLIIPYFMWKHEMSLWQASLLIALPASIVVAYSIHLLAEQHASKWLKGKLQVPKK